MLLSALLSRVSRGIELETRPIDDEADETMSDTKNPQKNTDETMNTDITKKSLK